MRSLRVISVISARQSEERAHRLCRLLRNVRHLQRQKHRFAKKHFFQNKSLEFTQLHIHCPQVIPSFWRGWWRPRFFSPKGGVFALMQSVLCEQSHDGYRACVKACFQTQSHGGRIGAVGHRLHQSVFLVFVFYNSLQANTGIYW